MSDEPSASTASQTTNADRHNETLRGAPTSTEVQRRRVRDRNRRMFNKKREAFLADLMRNVDLLVYAELSTIYYME